ncbi:DNAJ heat shock N-terminal domain-containing protein [Striga asiatica]|uniref:DNAJ heat shock N-terminal domain-containing protein n=1 Tax=Striga asiatica TaxID=4170 RepID=A0A5A7PIC2_STRAF|nr:DNAJ heat shock N-terminal domain-containing protein [Striga asiatica]
MDSAQNYIMPLLRSNSSHTIVSLILFSSTPNICPYATYTRLRWPQFSPFFVRFSTFFCCPWKYASAFRTSFGSSQMILSNTLVCKTHYEIIGVEEDASQEEIRKIYRTALLNYHPDKLQKSSEPLCPEHERNNYFLEVQKAWEVLNNPESRALYDNELRKSRLNFVNADDVSLNDMVVEDFGGCFELLYNCRCGDFFSIDSSELEEMGYTFTNNGGGEVSLLRANSSLPAFVILPCGSCSLKIRLIIDDDVKLMTKLN